MIELSVTGIGGNAAIILTDETSKALGVMPGSKIYLTATPEGYALSTDEILAKRREQAARTVDRLLVPRRLPIP